LATNGTWDIEGEEVLRFVQMDRAIWTDILGLVVILLVCRTAGYVYLRIFEKPGRK
jgi:hypothetical protein